MDIDEMILKLGQKGYFCSQILMSLALKNDGKDDPDLIRSMTGFTEGIGRSGGLCGAYLGAVAMLSYYAGKGEDDEIAHESLDEMIKKFTAWFEDYTAEYGGTLCSRIVGFDRGLIVERCPLMVRDSLIKCMELLEEYGAL